MLSLFRKRKGDDRATGEECYARGRWPEALAAYERVLALEPENAKALRRVADLRAKVGRRAEAVEAYRRLADLFAGSGFLVQAIAIQKILLRLDPAAADVGRKLAELYARRGLTAEPGPGEGKSGLPRIPLFSDLDPESFRQVLERVVPRALGPGEFLFREGDPGDSIFIVTSGGVRVTRGDVVLSELGEGEFLGEAAFFSREPRNADVSAAGAAELLELRRADAEALTASHPGVHAALGAFYRRRVLDGLLATSALFAGLSEAERSRIADLFRALPVAAGEVVLREGEAGRALFLVRRGRFRVATVPPGGSEPVHLGELGPSEFFGEVALVSGNARTATVSATEAGEVLRIDAEDLSPFLRAHPELGGALARAREERADDAVAKLLGKRP